MRGSRKAPSANAGHQRKGRPSFRDETANRFASIRLGDKVAYSDVSGRERVGVVSKLVARGVVMARVSGELCEQRITTRNFVRIEVRAAGDIPSRSERDES